MTRDLSRDLSPGERKVLQGIQAELRFQSRVERTLKATDKRILAWCSEHDLLPVPVTGAKVFGYTSQLVQAIEQRLAQLALAPLSADLKGSSLAQAEQGAAEHKSVREKPRDHRVLRYVFDAGDGAGQVVDVDQRELDLSQFADLVVVENLDCFYELHQFELPCLVNKKVDKKGHKQAQSLIVYRGDSHYSKGRAALINRWKGSNSRPLRYFGDLDPKGLHIAQSEGFTHIAAPAYEWFCEHATAQAYPAKQHDTARLLDASGELAPYVQFVQRQQKAVLQQWLQHVPLAWRRTFTGR
ncbi:DUF7281 domain-containing protein [Pseudidiomarina woesei]|uniref:DUF7281 domain-containing protein n=1 Tax=Pseudidiomarina woesei TaxID=1381080 RepID=A0A0K6GUD3_9GAMM|nr:hypothetical protein [Pseudidiomarina woesei]CUA82400.1 hypothetical protein Ga0061064_0015 [Pseudidiomarina woesei]